MYNSRPSSVTRGQEWTESLPEICQRAVLRKHVRRALDAQACPASALGALSVPLWTKTTVYTYIYVWFYPH